MVRLRVAADGKVTLKRAVLENLGVHAGDEVEIELVPQGQGAIRTGRTRKIESLFGLFKDRTSQPHSIEEINEAIEAGYAGEVRFEGNR